MPFTSTNTPEAILPRSDSRNPATTCKGLTTFGRPCRRSLANSLRNTAPSSNDLDGVVAVTPHDEAAFFCWQHKDQAKLRQLTRKDTKLYPLKERTSIDTLVSRLGILETRDTGKQNSSKPKTRQQSHKSRNDATTHGRKGSGRTARPSLLSFLCCSTQPDDDFVEIVRQKRRTDLSERTESNSNIPTNQARPIALKPESRRHQREGHDQKSRKQVVPQTSRDPSRPLSYIPPSLPPAIMSQLLTELSKPTSSSSEDGYIYMFWMTDSRQVPPSSSVSSSLLTPHSPRPSPNSRRSSDVLQQYSFPQTFDAQGVQKNTIMLKIGRANNVHRRMNEWTRQCGFDLSIVRFYPYVPSSALSPTPSPLASPSVSPRPAGKHPSMTHQSSSGVRKVPHVQRVERLIHIELSGQRVKKGSCSTCGKEHREWFELEASKDGLKAVDEVIRRWVGWAEDFSRLGTWTTS